MTWIGRDRIDLASTAARSIGRETSPKHTFSQKNPGSRRWRRSADPIRQTRRSDIFQDHPGIIAREVNTLPYRSVFQEDPRPLKFDDMGGYMVVNPLIAR